MPSAASPAVAPPPGRDLLALRAELDGIDDALHEMIRRRAEVVEEIAELGVKGRVPLRPGRQAAILRRLLARHGGRFPAVSLVMMWRELMTGMTMLQGPLRVAVCARGGDLDTVAAAREHFGALVALQTFETPAGAVHEVSAGHATAAVLPLPREEEPTREAWWTALLHKDERRIHVVARLPLWAARPEGAPQAEAFLVTAAAPDPSGEDRSLLGLELAATQSRGRLSVALAAAGFSAGHTILRRQVEQTVAHALVDVAGFVADDDPRLAALSPVLRPPVVVGAYAVPLEAVR